MSPAGILIFTPPSMFAVPPLCAVTLSTELSKCCCSIHLPHFITLPMLLKYVCVWNFSCKSFFPTSFALCRVSMVVSCWLFHLCPLTSGMTLARNGSAGRQWWSANMIPWQQAVAVISGYTCMGLHVFKAISIMTIQREENKGSCSSCITAQSQPAWTL